MKDIDELKHFLCNDNDVNKYWDNIQRQTERELRIISPPLNSLVSKVCYKLLIKKKTILWLGGPPGVGKTSCCKRFQDYGIMAMDCEDPWNKENRCTGLAEMTEKVYKELNTSFVFGACFGRYLLTAPKYVIPVLLLPDFNVYETRWKQRNPNDKQDHNNRYKDCQEIAEKHKNIFVLHQKQDECIDVTIYRICEMILNFQDNNMDKTIEEDVIMKKTNKEDDKCKTVEKCDCEN